MPPSQVARSSQRSRPRTPSAHGAPAIEERARALGAARERRGPGVRPLAAIEDSSAAPARFVLLGGNVQPAARQSIARSCQKFVSCSAVHTASDASSSEASRRPAIRSTSRPTGLADRRQ